MRNLKKLLALVLAMAMAFSLMLTVNAATYEKYEDKDEITEEFQEAVNVLTGLKVYEGDERGFRPAGNITRGEVAALVYRIATGDVGKDRVQLYANYGNFSDVHESDWFAGYVGYCANAGYIQGRGDGTFDPYNTVTGYEALAMILRVVGYDKNGEFTGISWQQNVSALATQLGVLADVKATNYGDTLYLASRRDVVASLLFNTLVKVPTVTYTPALQYNDKISLTNSGKNPTLGQKTFGLGHDTKWKAIDKWGTPGYEWYKGGSRTGWTDDGMQIYTGGTSIAKITVKPTATFNTANVHECDVADALDFDDNELFRLYVNNNTPITTAYNVVATDTVTRVGGQGRETSFWYDVTSEYAGDMDPWCTMVDTYLATVTRVTERVVDPAGHEIVPAYLYLDVYDGQGVGKVDKTNNYNVANATRNTSEHTAVKTGSNWEYVKGDKVLVKGYTDYKQNETSGQNNSGLNHIDPVAANTNSVEANNKAAFEVNRLLASSTTNDKKIEVVQKVTPVLGKQTVTYWNQDKHTVDGKDYPDAMTLFLDVAGTTTNTTFAWYFDKAGNLIGIDYVPDTVNYGVITSIYSAFNQGETSTDGTAKAIANVLYADGKEGTVTIDRFLLTQAATDGGHGAVDTKMEDTSTTPTTWSTAEENVELIPVYDNSTGNVMTSSERTTTTANNAKQAGWLHVAPVIAVNAVENGINGTNGATPTPSFYYGILKGNLFKFVASADGKMTAIEVAGKRDASNHANENDGVYEWNYNNEGTKGMIYKSFGYVALDTDNQAGDIWMDADTRIMINDGTSKQNVKCYTLSDLPGNVNFAANEIDWADPDGDGRADYIYTTGTIEGTTTYGLFYYNGGAAQWNGVDKKGTLFGWLNGAPTTVEFNSEKQFDAVKNSQSYAGHLFALQLTNNVVSNVMGVNQSATPDVYLLIPTAGTAITLGTADVVNTTDANLDYVANASAANGAGISFVTGVEGGNSYTANTEAVYIKDANDGVAANDVEYKADTRTVVLDSDVYYLTPGSKVIGLGMSVNQEGAILEYLNKTENDVTIVYEESGVKSIVAIYVATDPDVTFGEETSSTYTVSGNANTLGSGTTAATLGSVVASGTSNIVIYSPNAANPTFGGNAISGLASSADPKNLLYFPYSAPAGSAYTLRIFSGSSLVYSETSGSVTNGGLVTGAGDAHGFVIDITGATNVAGTLQPGMPLTTGTAYTFSITGPSGTVYSTGSFTLSLS